jgi:hypothetical protein
MTRRVLFSKALQQTRITLTQATLYPHTDVFTVPAKTYTLAADPVLGLMQLPRVFLNGLRMCDDQSVKDYAISGQVLTFLSQDTAGMSAVTVVVDYWSTRA